MDGSPLKAHDPNGLPTDGPPPGLVAASCAYLGAPCLLFFAGWLQWWLAVIFTGALILPCVAAVRRRAIGPGDALGESAPLVVTGRQLALLAVVAVALSSISGMGGYGVQEGDYLKHNAVLRDLVQKPWPVVVDSERGPFPLVYYVAWYLPAAAIGKLAGWTAANHFLFAWSVLGLVLSVLWFAVLVGRLGWATIAVFALFSAPDVLGAAALKLLGYHFEPPCPPSMREPGVIDWYALRWWNWEIRWWDGPCTWNYCSNMELLFWVPQQALASWIAGGMTIHAFARDDDARRTALLPAMLAALWSPLVTVGLAPFLLADAILDRRPVGARSRAWATWPNVACLTVLAVLAAYFAARGGELPFSDDPRAQFRFFGFDDWPRTEYLGRLGAFLLVDVAAVAVLIWAVRPPAGPRWRGLFWTAVALLVGLAFFRYGINNDLGMRVSMPSLLVLAVLLGKAATSPDTRPVRRLVLVGAMAVMATTPFDEVYRHLCEMRRRGEWIAVPDPAEVRSLWELSCEARDRGAGNDFFFRQYVGSPDAFFFRYLARSGAGVHPASERSATLRDSGPENRPETVKPSKEPPCPRPS